VAWWAREAGHGFPVHRTGFHSGWLAHKTALDQSRVKREEARTKHLDTRVSVLAGLREHRERQREAQGLIDKAIEDAGEDGQPAGGVPPLPADTVTTRRVDGKPETDADKGFFDLRESGYRGPIDQDGKIPDPSDPANGRPLELLDAMQAKNGQPPATPTEGAPPVAETAEMNYTAALEAATQIQEESEGNAEDAKRIQTETEAAVNDIRKRRISAALDALTGILQDGPTLSEAAEVDDALRRDQEAAEALAEAAGEREKAAGQLSEAAEAFRTGLVQRHGGVHEAVQDAPVEVAEMPFYRE
jgi:hypothetical protein